MCQRKYADICITDCSCSLVTLTLISQCHLGCLSHFVLSSYETLSKLGICGLPLTISKQTHQTVKSSLLFLRTECLLWVPRATILAGMTASKTHICCLKILLMFMVNPISATWRHLMCGVKLHFS